VYVSRSGNILWSEILCLLIDHWYSVPALLALVLHVGAICALGPTYSVVCNQLNFVSFTTFHSHFSS
jgi:hypothetical protein